MLILVGVTINVALKGDLFEQAQTAENDTQVQAEKEQLLSAIVASYDIETGTIKSESELRKNLGDGWTVVKEGSVYKVTSPKGNIFTVDENGNIDYKGKNTTGGEGSPVAFNWENVKLKVDTNTEYIAGDIVLYFSTNGKLSIVSSGMNVITIDATDSKYISNGIIDSTEEELYWFDEKVRLKVEMNSNNTDIDLTIIYFDDEGNEQESETDTCVKTSLDDEDIYTNEEVLQALGATGGEYKGTWTVIERDESGNPTKLVSTRAVTTCILGDDDDREKCISDYKNAESILNTAAQEATGIASARSINIEDIYAIIGEENVDKGSDYGKKWNYYYNTEDSKVYSKYQTGTDESGEIIWSEPHETVFSSQTFVDEEGKTVVVDSEGDNVTLTDTAYNYYLTEEQEIQLGTLSLEYIWLANTCMWHHQLNCPTYCVRLLRRNELTYESLFYSINPRQYGHEQGVCAVVSASGLWSKDMNKN